MDFSQVLAGQLLTDHARRTRNRQEDAFYETHGSSLYVTVMGIFKTSSRAVKPKEASKNKALGRPALQNVS